MKNFKWMMVIALGGLSLSCGEQRDSSKASGTGYSSEKEGRYADKEFSAWMSKADMQIAYDKRAEGTFFVYAKGRSNGGFHEYRYVSQAFPKEKFSEWASFWGMTPDEFYQMDVKMQRLGFQRTNVQVFEDKAGNAFYQSLWMKPRGSETLVTPKRQPTADEK